MSLTGDFENDLDLCELFCRVEEYCDAWLTVDTSNPSAYGGVCMGRGPPTADVWVPMGGGDHTSGRKSFNTCS